MMCGGHSESKPMTEEVKGIAMALKGAFETKTGKTYETFEPTTFTT